MNKYSRENMYFQNLP